MIHFIKSRYYKKLLGVTAVYRNMIILSQHEMAGLIYKSSNVCWLKEDKTQNASNWDFIQIHYVSYMLLYELEWKSTWEWQQTQQNDIKINENDIIYEKKKTQFKMWCQIKWINAQRNISETWTWNQEQHIKITNVTINYKNKSTKEK